MGGRTGGLGMRVAGKRTSLAAARRQSVRRSLSLPRNAVEGAPDRPEPDATPTLPASASPRKADVSRRVAEVEIKVDEASPPQDKEPMAANGAPAPVAGANAAPAGNIPIPFIPKFKGAAEMEARRQLRMRNRVPPGGAPRAQVSAPAQLNPEFSSSSSSSESILSVSDVEDQAIPEEDEDEDELDDEDAVPDVTGDMIDDEFDP